MSITQSHVQRSHTGMKKRNSRARDVAYAKKPWTSELGQGVDRGKPGGCGQPKRSALFMVGSNLNLLIFWWRLLCRGEGWWCGHWKNLPTVKEHRKARHFYTTGEQRARCRRGSPCPDVQLGILQGTEDVGKGLTSHMWRRQRCVSQHILFLVKLPGTPAL